MRLHPAKNGAETVGYARALEAWNKIFESTHATRSAVVEAECNGTVQVVGFGFATFVRKVIADAEVLHPAPGLNSRIIDAILCSRPVVATYEEVLDANTRGDLQQVILDTSWKQGCLTAAQVDEVRVLLGQSYMELFSGYNFARILSECVDEVDLWHIRGHRSFKIVDRFESYWAANPRTTWNRDRALGVVTTESMRDDPHSVAAGLFHCRRLPKLGFARGEQELLEVALEGVEDSAASKILFVTVAAIKRRWTNIFSRVASVMPELCPAGKEGTRGVQKRSRVLAYVRSNPQELRPFNLGNRSTSKRRTAEQGAR